MADVSLPQMQMNECKKIPRLRPQNPRCPCRRRRRRRRRRHIRRRHGLSYGTMKTERV